MLDRINGDFGPLDFQALSREQQVLYRERIVRQANTERAAFISALVGRMFKSLAKRFAASIAGTAAKLTRWRADYAVMRTNRAAVTRLMALDDGMLRDIGVRRSEIESIVHLRGRDETRRQRERRAA